MENNRVIEDFLNHKNSKSSNLISIDDKLISYDTCIAQFYNGYLLINTDKYSVTTSKQQNCLKKLISDLSFITPILYVNNIEKEVSNLD